MCERFLTNMRLFCYGSVFSPTYLLDIYFSLNSLKLTWHCSDSTLVNSVLVLVLQSQSFDGDMLFEVKYMGVCVYVCVST